MRRRPTCVLGAGSACVPGSGCVRGLRCDPGSGCDQSLGCDLGCDPGSGCDRGSASVLVVAVLALVAAMTFAALQLAAVSVSRHRAAAAADLAAIAGAVASPTTPVAICGLARHVASLNGAEVTECRPDGTSVLVRVDVLTGHGGTKVSASARAGSDPDEALGVRTSGHPVLARADRSIARAALTRKAAP